MMRPGLAWTAVLLGLAACSGNPQPGESGYKYNLTGDYEIVIDLDGARYVGTMAMSTMKGGGVTGTMEFDSPEIIRGDLSGTIAGDSLSFTSTYERSGCMGIVQGDGSITEGGGSAMGVVGIDDECAPGPMAGDFQLTLE